MKLSVVIPAHNEAGCVESTIRNLHSELLRAGIDHEIIIVNDHSSDETENICAELSQGIPGVRYINNPYGSGFGLAVCSGLEHFTGDAAAIYMADASDRPED